MAIDSLIAFTLSSVLLALAPGPDNLFVLSQSAVHGRQSGFLITLGLCSGLIGHTLLVTFGVALIFQNSPWTFHLLRTIGALYLLYIAWQMVSHSTRIGYSHGNSKPMSPAALYRRGIIMNLSNPKVSLFFMAFLPQFIDPGSWPVSYQTLILGMVFIIVTLLIFGLISILGSQLGGWFNRDRQSGLWLNRVAAFTLVLISLHLLLS